MKGVLYLLLFFLCSINITQAEEPARVQNNTGLFDRWTETDYSEYEITHEYFTPDGTAPSSSGGYDMTGYIPVKEGDVIVISGDRSPGIPFVMGYIDSEAGATVLLGNFDANNMDNIRVKDMEVTIPAGTAYVRCSARNTSVPGWASRNMSVIKRSSDGVPSVVRVLAMGNSFTIDCMESSLYAVARDAGIHLVLGNACWGGFSFEEHYQALISDSPSYEYRKCDNGVFTINWGQSTPLSTIFADEPWDIVVFQQASHFAGFYDTYEPSLTNLINELKMHFPNAKYGLHMIWAYSQDSKNPKFVNYNSNQMFMYNSIVDATRKTMEAHPELEFLIPTGTAVQNLRTSFVGDALNRDGSHLTVDLGRATAAYSWYAVLFGEEMTLQSAFTPYNLNAFSTTMAKNAAIAAVHNPYSITPQDYTDYTGNNTIIPSDIYLNFSHWGTKTEGWNDVTLHEEFGGGYKDIKGKDSGIIIRSDNHFSGANTSGTSNANTPLNMPAEVSQTALLGYSEGDVSGLEPHPTATFNFMHLNKALTYDFTFFSSRTFSTDNRETQFSLTGTDTKTAVLDASDNRTNTVTISGMSPNDEGTITLTVQAGPNNNNPNKFYYLNALRISAHNPVGDTWQYIIDKYGYDPATVTDLTGSAKIKIDEPNCAYVNITGISQMPTKKRQNLHAWLECYDGNGNYFKKRVILNDQGQSTSYWEKRNIAVDFCEDEWEGKEETDITIGRWVKQSSFHLKANYTTYFRGESQIGYMIYDGIIADRYQPFPWQRAGIMGANEKAVGHPLGFPCYVYLNGKFYGLFAWQLKKHRKNMNQEKGLAEHIHIEGKLSNLNFWNGQINWEKFEIRNPKTLYCMDAMQGDEACEEYDKDFPKELVDQTMPCYDASNEGHVLSSKVKEYIVQLSQYKTELREIIAAGANKAVVRKKFEECFDVQSMLDYVVFSYVTANGDGFERNWQWITYDGVKWYVMPYDLDCIFGNMWQGTFFFPPEVFWYFARYDHLHNTGPITFFLNYYKQEIVERYKDLRYSGQISCESFMQHFRSWYERIGEEGYSLEYDRWPNSPCNGETILSPNWTTSDQDWLNYTWDDYYSFGEFDKTRSYKAGDKCTYGNRIWTATGTTQGVKPYIQLAHTDRFERVENYISRKIELLDEYFDYDRESYEVGIENLASDTSSTGHFFARKVIRGKHLYILKDNEIYSVDGKRVE